MYLGFIAPLLTVVKETADKHRKLKIDIYNGIMSLHRELRMIGKKMDEHEDQEFQELAYDIEDFLPELFAVQGYHAILLALRFDKGTTQLEVINHFLKRVVDLQNNQKGEASASACSSVASSRRRDSAVLVGTGKSELEDLLSAEDGELRVVSIVGGIGMGKTSLAWDVAQKFDCKAFVVASECIGEAIPSKATDLLRKILKEVSTASRARQAAPTNDGSDADQLAIKLKNFLWTRRYLVVIDDVKEFELWKILKRAFPNNKISGSRIIVTTSIQSVATSLSHGRYRYTMRGLNRGDSKKLILREIYGNDPTNEAIVNSLESLLIKCDGSPLALVSAAEYLKPKLKVKNCIRLGTALGTVVAVEEDGCFRELKRALVECYSSLPKYHERRSLLSIAMSPKGHPINKNSLLRRCIAEGLVSIDHQYNEKDVASKTFYQFVDRGIMDAGLIGSNSKVKRYKVQGIMLEFIVHKSTCATNFATIIDPLIHPKGRLPLEKDVNNRIRRLFVSEGAKSELIEDVEDHLDYIRWLTICHSPTSTRIPFDLRKCKLLRVLVLEGCKGVEGTVLANICELVNSLKYLSLRGSDVRHITTEITKLVNLEMLDIRDTEVNKLPMEILLMPGLAHLFGQFELVGSLGEVTAGLKEKRGKLETLSRVIIDKEEQGFKEIMLHAKELKKVKIWCKATISADIIPPKKFSGSEALDSLSVDSSTQPINMLTDSFLESTSGDWAIKSVKLRGPLPQPGLPVKPGNFMKLKLVEKLHLSSTGLKWEALSLLQKMSRLLKLKLSEYRHESEDESFIVEQGGFISLEQLCIEAPKLPKVQLKKGATPCLVSLELMLCDETQLLNHATAEISSPQPVAPPQTHAMPEIPTSEEETPLQDGAIQVETTALSEAPLEMRTLLENSHEFEAPLQMGATSEITPAEPEDPLQNEAILDVTTAELEAPPPHTGAALENTTQQNEALTQTKENLICWIKKTLNAKARKVGIYIRLRCNLCWSQAPVQIGATREITIPQTEQSTVETGAASITTHQPVQTGTSSEIIQQPVQMGGPSGFTTNELVQTGAASQITTHHPSHAAVASDTTTHQQVEPSVQNGAPAEDSTHQTEQNAIQTGATSGITTHLHAQTGAASDITPNKREQASIQNGATSEITPNQQVEPRVQIGLTTGNTSHQQEQNAVQNGGTSEDTTHQQVVSAQTIEEIELYLGVGGLLHLLQLDEVIIHHSTGDKAMQYWEEVSNKHINKPHIKKRSLGQKAGTQPPHAC